MQYTRFSSAAPAPSRVQRQGGAVPSVQQILASKSSTRRVQQVANVMSDADMERCILPDGTVDYYELLGVDDDAPMKDVKSAYRQLAKQCHPDRLGSKGHDVCVLLNEAYETLQNPVKRESYNIYLREALRAAVYGFTGESISKWVPDVAPAMSKAQAGESRAVWVDEVSCIGCTNCVYTACATFRLEPQYGRARVYAQWLNDEEEIKEAIDTCPVECIHFVRRDELPFLEFITQVEYAEARVNVGLMQSALGGRRINLLKESREFMKDYRAQKQAQERESQYSAVVNNMRKQAVKTILRTQCGWVGGVIASIMDDIMPDQRVTFDADDVGKRKRKNRRGAPPTIVTNYIQERSTPIPQQLALVPIRVDSGFPFSKQNATPSM